VYLAHFMVITEWESLRSFGQYKEYHTSYDNKELMNFKKMSELIYFCTSLVKAYELNDNYVNQIRYGEPFLRKRDMFENLSTKLSHSDLIKMRLRLLNYLDDTKDLVNICLRRSNVPVRQDSECIARNLFTMGS